MDDVISLSSGGDEDSDIEFVSSYRDDSSTGVPFIRAELLPVTPVSHNLAVLLFTHKLAILGYKPEHLTIW